jgi:hypothetical protein
MNGTDWAAKRERERELAEEFAAVVAPLFTPLTLEAMTEPDPDNPSDEDILDAIRKDTHR